MELIETPKALTNIFDKEIKRTSLTSPFKYGGIEHTCVSEDWFVIVSQCTREEELYASHLYNKQEDRYYDGNYYGSKKEALIFSEYRHEGKIDVSTIKQKKVKLSGFGNY